MVEIDNSIIGQHGQASRLARKAAQEAVQLVRSSGTVLWKTPTLEAFASIREKGHTEHHPIRSKAFAVWLKRLFYTERGDVLSAQAFSDALGALEAEALGAESKTYPVYSRIGGDEERIYLDLADPDWRVVEIDAEGWRVIPSENAPVRFRRSPYQKPLPVPRESKSGLFDYLSLLPLRDDRDIAAVLSWLVGTLLPRGPYPVLILRGEKGAGKSTTARLLKNLIDPTEAPLLFEPRSVEDLLVSTVSNHILVFDNLSRIPIWFSDALSRLSTEGGVSKRRLYTDAEEVVINAVRPIILTGISFGEIRDDLADRALIIELQRINDGDRLTDDEVEENSRALHPDALGQILDAASLALGNRKTTRERLTRLPRMSTWAVWAEAAAPALGLEAGEAVRAYNETQATLSREQVDLDPVAQAVLKLYEDLEAGTTKEYTTTELLKELERVYIPEGTQRRPDEWPSNAKSLGRKLPRLAEALRLVGVRIASRVNTKTKSRVWLLSKPSLDEQTAPANRTPDRRTNPPDGTPNGQTNLAPSRSQGSVPRGEHLAASQREHLEETPKPEVTPLLRTPWRFIEFSDDG